MPSPTPPAIDEEARDGPDDSGIASPPSFDESAADRRQIPLAVLGVKRGARTLTSAQLEKKRANDRDAQRAIRERTKSQIETLENRIKDLESGEAYQQLQDALKEKQMIEAENADLKNRLSGVLEILKPLFPPRQFQDVSNRHVESASVPTFYNTYAPSTSHMPPNPNRDPYNPLPAGQDIRQNMQTSPWVPPRPNQIPPLLPREQPPQFNDQLYRGGDNNAPMKRELSSISPGPPLEHHQSIYDRSNGYRTSVSRSLTSEPSSPGLCTSLPANIAPTCSYDSLIHEFIMEGRQRVSSGEPLANIVGAKGPVMNALIEHQSEVTRAHQFSTLLIDMLKGYPAVDRLPEKIAIVSVQYAFIRWMISPTRETFDDLPPYIRPTEKQLEVRHPLWIDHIPWPAMRDKMVYQYTWLPLEKFFIPYTTNMRLNHPHNDLKSNLYRDPTTGQYRVNPQLAERISKLESFSLGPAFAREHPTLADTCTIRNET